MLIKIEKRKGKGKRFIRVLILLCAVCNKEFERIYRKSDADQPDKLHFCNKECVDNAAKNSEILHKKKQKTCMNLFGTENAFQNEDIKEKIKQTSIEKYGYSHYRMSSKMKNSYKESMTKNFGVENVFQLESVKEKIRNTCLEKFNVDNPMKSESVVSKFDYHEIARKSHLTKKKKGSYKSSKTELKLLKILEKHFPKIQNQVPINNWLIDVYVPEHNVFIEFDGIYWHGLNKSDEELKASETKHSKTILRTKYNDKKKDEYFKNNKMTLIRVPYRQIKDVDVEFLIKTIKEINVS